MERKKHSPAVFRLLVFTAILSLVFGFGLSQSRAWVASAQDGPTPSPSATPDAEKERLQREADLATLKKTKAEADKAAAEARKAEFEATFPKPTSSPLEGKTTVEGAVIESQMISYVSLARAANRIVEAIKGVRVDNNPINIRKLAIYNERDVNLMLSYKVANTQTDGIRQSYCSLLSPAATVNIKTNSGALVCPTPPPGPAPDINAAQPSPAAPVAPLAIAQSFLGAFVDLTALLRTNVEIKGQTFVIDEGPLVAEVFRAARRATPDGLPATAQLYYPYVFPPNVNTSQGSELLARLEAVHRLRVRAEEIVDDLTTTSNELGAVNDKIDALNESIDKTIPKQTADAITTSGNIIKANCRRLTGDVDEIKTLPADQRGDAMVRLIEKARRICQRMDKDKLEELLGLSDTIQQLEKSLSKAKDDLDKATTKQGDLESHLKDIEALLDPGALIFIHIPGQKDEDDPEQARERIASAVARLNAVNAQFDSFVNSLVQADASGVNPLTNYIRIESLFSAVPPDDGSYWLQLKVINAGGNNRIKTNLLVDIFTGGNRVSHSGGVIVQYNLFDSNGRSVGSDTIADYTNYIKANKVHGVTNSRPNRNHPADDDIDARP